MSKVFQRIVTDDVVLNRVQDNVATTLAPLTNNPLSSCHIIANIHLTSGSKNQVNHGLSRNLIGWFVVDQTLSGSIWRDTNNKTPDRILYLRCDAHLTASVMVF